MRPGMEAGGARAGSTVLYWIGCRECWRREREGCWWCVKPCISRRPRTSGASSSAFRPERAESVLLNTTPPPPPHARRAESVLLHLGRRPTPSTMLGRVVLAAASLRSTPITMGASEWLSSTEPLPLLVAPLGDALLPGEARRMVLSTADELAAVDAARRSHGCLAMLLRTRSDSALTASPLLELRSVRPLDVGAAIEVVAVGRVDVQSVIVSRGAFVSRGAVVVRDSDMCGIAVHCTDEALLDMVSSTAEKLHELRAKLDTHRRADGTPRGVVVPTTATAAAASRAPLPLDAAARARRDELCAYDLDQLPHASLQRLHRLWGVASEVAADEQVLSFAACAGLSAGHRAKALGITNTAERLQHAHRGLERLLKLAAARLAVREAFAA